MHKAPRVLIVEDDVDLAEVTCEVLALSGVVSIYRTTVADAMEALSLHKGSITVLVTDIHLASPMSGIELAVYVAQEWPDVAICATSGISHERPRRLPDKCAFLPKPWHPPTLVAFVRDAGGLGSARSG